MSEDGILRISDAAIVDWIHFRSSHSLLPVVVQSFMILCALIIVFGLVYVVLLVLAIIIHHICYDRNPRKVPDYVKYSLQFSGSESETEEDEEANTDNVVVDFKAEEEDVNKDKKHITVQWANSDQLPDGDGEGQGEELKENK